METTRVIAFIPNYLEGKFAFRVKQAAHQTDPLLRALKVPHLPVLHIIDAMGGFGYDAFLCASQGHTVHSIEKNPEIFAALKQAHTQLQHQGLCLNWTISEGEAATVLTPASAEVVYLDPMFPGKKKSLPKKGMALIQTLAPIEPDSPILLEAALRAATHKVVIKRPRTGPYYAGKKPTYSLTYQAIRYDIYATKT